MKKERHINVSIARVAIIGTYLLEGRDHNIRTVVDSQHNVSNTRSSQALYLMQDHRAISEFHQGLGKCQSLIVPASLAKYQARRAIDRGEGGGIPKAVDGCQNLRQE